MISRSAAAAIALSSAVLAATPGDFGLSRKAGLSGYDTIQNTQAFSDLAPYISWYSDYNPNTPNSQGVKGIPMLWGAEASPCQVAPGRLSEFKSAVASATPPIMFGFYEPDCNCQSSSQTSVSDAASSWDSLLVPLANKGTILGSPSMCRQFNEDFLTPFEGEISRSWDVTSIHINKNSLSGVEEDVNYYANKYGKPIWVSEFACVDDQNGFNPCTDQGEVNDFINDVVNYLQNNDNVVAYGPSNGEGLGNVNPMTDSNGDLTETGQTYLNAIRNL